MIKTEVVFDVDAIKIGKYQIIANDENMDGIVYEIFLGRKFIGGIYPLEDAIKHCLEQKPHNKYNWSLIPEHVQFMATDEDGMACGWLVEPKIMGNAWRHQAHLSAFFHIDCRNNYLNHYRGDWKDSLEQRPEQQSQ